MPDKKIWNFSLREMLFALTTVAALVALAVQMQKNHFEPSPFFDVLDVDAVLQESATELGQKLQIPAVSGSSGRAPDEAHEDREVVISSPDDSQRLAIMSKFRELVLEKMAESGCQVAGSGYSGDLDAATVSDFHFRYRYGNTRGFCYAYSFAFDPQTGNWKILVLRNEW